MRESMEKGIGAFGEERGSVREAAEEGYWLLIDEV